MLEKYLEKAEAVHDSLNELWKFWQDHDEELDLFEEQEYMKYPFKQSLEDLLSDCHRWVKTIKAEIALIEENLIALNSVGALINPKTLQTYPQLADGSPDLDISQHVADCSSGWYLALSADDFKIIKDLKISL